MVPFKTQTKHLIAALLLLPIQLFPGPTSADETSARAAMESAENPLVVITSGAGNIYLELLEDEAPRNVQNFLALAEGELEITDRQSGQTFSPRYFDGMTFHRVIPGFLIQTGSPAENVFGEPAEILADEINASSLGLDRMPAVLADGSFNPILQLSDREDLEEALLVPLYRTLGIESNGEIAERQYELDQHLRTLTIKQVYENQGYRYTEQHPTRPISRGTVALTNSGPNTNSAGFFISLVPAEWLNGRYTVIGRVVEGLDVVERINQQSAARGGNRRATLIYSIRRL
ncbi:MAG: peptidylprolyl isomerase [Gammaproteobacteria bacterium]|jgi:peptidyl-prolyl cis-trans isomerase A (cyclophilin A)